MKSLSSVKGPEIIDEVKSVVARNKEDGPCLLAASFPGALPAGLRGEVPLPGKRQDIQGETLIYGLLGHHAFSSAKALTIGEESALLPC
jgi:hypothetical protein